MTDPDLSPAQLAAKAEQLAERLRAATRDPNGVDWCALLERSEALTVALERQVRRSVERELERETS